MNEEKILIGEYKPLSNVSSTEIVTEAEYPKTKDSILSTFKTLYMHMLKLMYQPERQTGSWINSITRSADELNKSREKVGRALWNKVTLLELKKYYTLARYDAASETRKLEKVFLTDFPSSEWYLLDILLDRSENSFINQFIENYTVRDEAIKYFEVYKNNHY